MAAAQGVGTAQRYNLLVIEAHAVEDVAQVSVAFAGVRQPAVGRARRHVLVGAAWPVWNGRTLHLLDGYHAGEDPEVGGRNPGELSFRGRGVS